MSIENLREQIDEVDESMLRLLARRWVLVDQVADLKRREGLEPLQPARYEEMMQKRRQLAEQLGVPVSLVDDIWHTIHDASVEYQKENL